MSFWEEKPKKEPFVVQNPIPYQPPVPETPAEPQVEVPFTGDLKLARKQFSRMGLGVFLIYAVALAVQLVIALVLRYTIPGLLENEWIYWLLTTVPLYAVGIPAGLAVMLPKPKQEAVYEKMTAGRFICLIFIAWAMMYFGALVGNILNSIFTATTGVEVGDEVADLALSASILPKLLFMVVVGPIMEELVFRKALIDRMRIYGEKTAVVVSALLFGLFHGNLAQLFYAFTLGLLFGYVYLRTGKLRYTVILHVFINFMGSVVSAFVVNSVDTDTVLSVMEEGADPALLVQLAPQMAVAAIYNLVVIAMLVAGVVLFFVKKRDVHFERAPLQLPYGTLGKTVFRNFGMILLLVGCAALIVLSLV